MPREIYKNPKERNAKISIGLLGRVVSAETRKKISLANTGRITSPESRLKQSLAHKGKKYFLGKKHSFESIEKMRNAIRPAMTEETKRKMSISRSGERNYFFGKKMSEETKLKISSSKMGKSLTKEHIDNVKKNLPRAEKHWAWIKDRSLIKLGDRNMHDPLTKQWRKQVKDRDGWSCRIADINCDGRLEVHHILRWADFPELRYVVNNGITLCHAHHPRKIAEEKRLIPTFTELVSMSVSKKPISHYRHPTT